MSQISGGGLVIERCFGVLLASGRNVKHSDMQLLEMVRTLNLYKFFSNYFYVIMIVV